MLLVWGFFSVYRPVPVSHLLSLYLIFVFLSQSHRFPVWSLSFTSVFVYWRSLWQKNKVWFKWILPSPLLVVSWFEFDDCCCVSSWIFTAFIAVKGVDWCTKSEVDECFILCRTRMCTSPPCRIKPSYLFLCDCTAFLTLVRHATHENDVPLLIGFSFKGHTYF